MMFRSKAAVLAVVAGVLLLAAQPSLAKPEVCTKECQACSTHQECCVTVAGQDAECQCVAVPQGLRNVGAPPRICQCEGFTADRCLQDNYQRMMRVETARIAAAAAQGKTPGRRLI